MYTDKLAGKLAALVVPAALLRTVMCFTGYTGAAAITTALSWLSPFGMAGGLLDLGILGLLAEWGAEKAVYMRYRSKARSMLRKGDSVRMIELKSDTCRLSDGAKYALVEDAKEYAKTLR